MQDVRIARPGSGRVRRGRRSLARYRRWLAAASAAVAVAVTVNALAPPAPATDPVPVAARDLPAGRTIGSSDLVTADWPRGSRPDGVLPVPVGRTLATAVRRGEPLTDTRVTGPGMLTGQPAGTVAVTVRLSDPASSVLLAPGHRIDLLGGPVADGLPGGPQAGDGGSDRSPSGAGEQARLLAANVLVLALPTVRDPAGPDWAGAGLGAVGTAGGGSGGGDRGSLAGVVIVAVDHDTAARLAAAGGARSISAALTGPSTPARRPTS